MGLKRRAPRRHLPKEDILRAMVGPTILKQPFSHPQLSFCKLRRRSPQLQLEIFQQLKLCAKHSLVRVPNSLFRLVPHLNSALCA